MKTDIHFWSHLAHLFLDWDVFQTKVEEEIKYPEVRFAGQFIYANVLLIKYFIQSQHIINI